jgi:GAF domain-containing protein
MRASLEAVSESGPDTQVTEAIRRPSRLRALADLAANAQTSAEALDRIARVACRVLGVPVALVNLIGADRQRFVGCDGPEPWSSMGEMPLSAGFCPFALLGEPYVIDDARTEHAANPAVEQLGVVAYAGVPLRAADGEPIGTLCAVDFEPRAWSEEDLQLMSDLAAGVIAELQLLTATRLIAQDQVRLRSLAELSSALAPAEDARDVLDEVGRSVDRLGTQGMWLSLVDTTDDALRTAAAAGAVADDVAAQLDVPLAAPVPPADVVRTGEPEFLTTQAEVQDRFGELAAAMPGGGSVAVVPLTAGDQRLGVLGVSFAGERPLSETEREYLTAIGGVSGLALARRPAAHDA